MDSNERVRCGLSVLMVALAGSCMAQDFPATLTPPPDAMKLGSYTAQGIQIYICSAHGTVKEWTFEGPRAELFDGRGTAFAKHFAGPTWEAPDGSKVVGKVLQTAPAPVAGAIPWLLLSAESTGQGALAGVIFVQRIKTAGGVGPTGACGAVGAEQSAPYTAEYVFYK